MFETDYTVLMSRESIAYITVYFLDAPEAVKGSTQIVADLNNRHISNQTISERKGIK